MPRRKISDFEDLKHRDSDGDGLSDYDEIFVYHSDPLNTDSGHDGFTDYQRARLNLDSINNVFMKDFFIPNESNNFKPHILKPRRLFFYSISAVAIKIFVMATVLVFPATAWLTPDFLKAESTQIVALTNGLRQSLGLQTLENNEVLQAAAFAKAEDMVVNQYFAHVSPEKKGLRHWLSSKGYNYQVAGENLAIGYSAPTEVLEAWKNSPTHYANLIDPDYNEIGVAMIAGNYEGFDTKLVAQMFGFQKVTPTPEPIVVTEPTKSVVTVVDEPTVLAEKTTNPTPLPVVVEKPKPIVIVDVEEPLAQPSIVTGIEGLLTNKKSLDIKVLAPEATEVVLWVNDKKQASAKTVDNQVIFDLALNEGQNKLVAQSILAEQSSFSPEYVLELDTQAPTVEAEQSFISAISPKDQEVLIKIEAILSTDTKVAVVKYHGFDIPLKQDLTNDKLWVANRLIANVADNFFSPVVPASLVATDLAGNTLTEDLAWQKILLDTPSPVNQYLFIKNTESSNIKPIFDLSTWYFRVMLLVAFVALLLNIFIEIKKQHLKTIASTVAFMTLLSLLILF